MNVSVSRHDIAQTGIPLLGWASSIYWGSNTDGIVSYSYPKAEDVLVEKLTQWFKSGEIWGIDTRGFNDVRELSLAHHYILKHWCAFLKSAHEFLDRIGAAERRTVEAGVVGLAGVLWANAIGRAGPEALDDSVDYTETHQKWEDSEQFSYVHKLYNALREAFGLSNLNDESFRKISDEARR